MRSHCLDSVDDACVCLDEVLSAIAIPIGCHGCTLLVLQGGCVLVAKVEEE